MPNEDVRLLRGLASPSEQDVPESAIEAVERRAIALATALAGRGARREADALRRRVALLERADERHRHAADLEIIAGLVQALTAFAGDGDGMLEENAGHGPAFRETRALRNRAFHFLVASLAALGR